MATVDDKLDLLINNLLVDKSISNPVLYQYYKQLENRSILWNQEVDETIVEMVYLPLRSFEQDNINKPITLYISSAGGSVSDGYFLANYLSQYQKRLNIIILGYCCSMAAVVVAGCRKNKNITVYAYPESYFLLHDGYVSVGTSEAGTARDLMDFNNTVDRHIKEMIISHTNITEEEYNSKARSQWFLFADEAKEKGLVDKIFGVDDCEVN